MTPKRPIELVDASIACSEAWSKRNAMIDANDVAGTIAMNDTCRYLDERYQSLYLQWQILGGTSDIDSIALFEFRTDSERENLGTHWVISGGEALELSSAKPADNDRIPF